MGNSVQTEQARAIESDGSLTMDCGPATTEQALLDSAAQRVVAEASYNASASVGWTRGAEVALGLTRGALDGMGPLPPYPPLMGRHDYALRLLSWLREPGQWAQVLTREEAAQERKGAEQRQRAYFLACRASAAKFRRTISRKVRAACGCPRSPYPIDVDDTDDAPALYGRSYHWVTPSGKPVYYPSAYRRAWGRPVYVGSTRHIVVGRGWLAAQGLPIAPDAVPQ